MLLTVLKKTALRHKSLEGTSWISYQVEALKLHLENLSVMLTFTNEQVKLLYNAIMQKEMFGLEGIREKKLAILSW